MSVQVAPAEASMTPGAVWMAMAKGSRSANRIVQRLAQDARGRTVIHYRTSHGPKQCSQAAWDSWIVAQGGKFTHVSVEHIHRLFAFSQADMARVVTLLQDASPDSHDTLHAAAVHASQTLRDDAELQLLPPASSDRQARAIGILYALGVLHNVPWQYIGMKLASLLRDEGEAAP